jgi:hypothetical protein
MRFPHPGGPGGFAFVGSIFTDIVAGLVFIIAFVVVVGLLVVLVRFLLAATKAAELYVANNTAKDEPTVGGPTVVESPAAAPTVVTKTTPTRARTTKPPTT